MWLGHIEVATTERYIRIYATASSGRKYLPRQGRVSNLLEGPAVCAMQVGAFPRVQVDGTLVDVQSKSVKSPASLVLDVTYRCNSPCRYCRWGHRRTEGRLDMPLEHLRLPEHTLRTLSTERVVLCGGEPLLHPELSLVVEHYARLVRQVVVITNGLLLTEERLNTLLDSGLTGVVFSIDSTDPTVFRANRGLDSNALDLILRNLRSAASLRSSRPVELGINAVVTSASATLASVRAMISLAEELNIDAVKFAPVFDDGFLGENAPELALNESCVPALKEISRWSHSVDAHTNPPSFWDDLARLAKGRPFDGLRCGLDGNTALVTRGRIALCYWVPEADVSFSAVPEERSAGVKHRLPVSVANLKRRQPTCDVSAHCWCMQAIDHCWRQEGNDAEL